MGRVIGFSELPDYLLSLQKKGSLKATILDTNILVTSGYEVREDHTDVTQVLDVLAASGFRFFCDGKY